MRGSLAAWLPLPVTAAVLVLNRDGGSDALLSVMTVAAAAAIGALVDVRRRRRPGSLPLDVTRGVLAALLSVPLLMAMWLLADALRGVPGLEGRVWWAYLLMGSTWTWATGWFLLVPAGALAGALAGASARRGAGGWARYHAPDSPERTGGPEPLR
jgi:hypothetical protein